MDLFITSISISFSIISIFIGRVITKFAHIAFLSVENRIMNHIMGSIFGMIKGGISLIIFFWFISILPLQKWTPIINESSKLINYLFQQRKIAKTT